ncbi:hypothetical protein ACFWVC_32250 [Streptomyces sp. NPDC058691]|uniref:hypothetical protein n=1 Tax=Streptomyces sp. NPDC058691 TaxID=3346601 RepID=UPI00365556F5
MADTLAVLASRIANLERLVRDLSRTSRLANSSIENGAIAVYDNAGTVRGSIGLQPDGTLAVAAVNGPTPPVPSAPTIVSVLGGVAVGWNGAFADGSQALADFAYVEVRFSASEDFTDEGTLHSAFYSPVGGTLVVPADGPVWVRLVCVSTSGVTSEPSAVAGPAGPRPVVAQAVLDGIITELALADGAVSAAKIEAGAVGSVALADNAVLQEHLHDAAVATGKLADGAVRSGKIAADAVTTRELAAGAVTAVELAAGAVTADKLTVVGSSNILPDPSFEGPVTAAAAAARPGWSVDAIGNGSAKSLKVDATSATPIARNLTLTSFAVLPGDQLYLAVDYMASSNWVGQSLKFYAGWIDASGAMFSWGTVVAQPPVLGPTWQRLAGTVTAPPGALRAAIIVETFNSTAGTVWWDNAAVRPVLPGVMIADGAITTPKIVAGSINGDRLAVGSVAADRIAAASITAAQIEALGITADRLAVNSVTASKIVAGSIDATHIKAQAITAALLAADAIDGKTITGATVQTAKSGPRLLLSGNHLYAVDNSGKVLAEFVPDDGTGRSAFRTYDTRLGDNFYGALTAGDVRFGIVGQTAPQEEAGISYSSLGGGLYELLLSSGCDLGSSSAQVNLYSETAPAAGNSAIDLNADAVDALGVLTANNIVLGSVTITPSASNTPTSVTVTGLHVAGKTFRAFVTVFSGFPGSGGVTGVTVSNVSSAGLTVWLNRVGTNPTTVYWLVVGA